MDVVKWKIGEDGLFLRCADWWEAKVFEGEAPSNPPYPPHWIES